MSEREGKSHIVWWCNQEHFVVDAITNRRTEHIFDVHYELRNRWREVFPTENTSLFKLIIHKISLHLFLFFFFSFKSNHLLSRLRLTINQWNKQTCSMVAFFENEVKKKITSLLKWGTQWRRHLMNWVNQW